MFIVSAILIFQRRNPRLMHAAPYATPGRHVKDEHVNAKDAAQDVAEDVTQDVAEDALGAAEDGSAKARRRRRRRRRTRTTRIRTWRGQRRVKRGRYVVVAKHAGYSDQESGDEDE